MRTNEPMARPASVVLIPAGRDGDYQPSDVLHNVSLRRLAKQLRRIRSIRDQVKAFMRHGNCATVLQCLSEWPAIYNAPGFAHGFAHWASSVGCVLTGDAVPDLQTLETTAEVLELHVKQCEHVKLCEDV